MLNHWAELRRRDGEFVRLGEAALQNHATNRVAKTRPARAPRNRFACRRPARRVKFAAPAHYGQPQFELQLTPGSSVSTIALERLQRGGFRPFGSTTGTFGTGRQRTFIFRAPTGRRRGSRFVTAAPGDAVPLRVGAMAAWREIGSRRRAVRRRRIRDLVAMIASRADDALINRGASQWIRVDRCWPDPVQDIKFNSRPSELAIPAKGAPPSRTACAPS